MTGKGREKGKKRKKRGRGWGRKGGRGCDMAFGGWTLLSQLIAGRRHVVSV